MIPSSPAADRSIHRIGRMPGSFLTRAVAIVAIFFLAIAPTLSWPQFSGDSEDLVVQTVLQIRNGGPWWIPMLGDQPRSKKPPLPTWIAAASVTNATMQGLASTDPATRESAYRWLAWEVRWPSLLAACGMLIAVACLANLIGGPAHVIPSILIFGSSLMFLRYTRSATTDVYLALGVLVANAFLALAILRDRWWLGCIGAGTALGLALMCKGPVSLVQALLPIGTFLLIRKIATSKPAPSSLDSDEFSRVAPSRRRALPIAIGTFTMLALGLPWYLSVLLRNPESLSTWLTEIDRHGAAVPSHAPLLAYLILLPNLFPWLPMFIAGVYLICKNFRVGKPITLALFLVFVPIVFMSFFPDRKERYLLPMAGPAAILAAHAAVRMKRSLPTRDFASNLVWVSYWAILIVFAIGVPIACGLLLKDPNGQRCISIGFQLITLIAASTIVIVGIMRQSKWRVSFLYAGAALMLLLNAFFLYGWSQSTLGLSEMKPLADRLHAAFPRRQIVYFDPPPDGKPVTLDLYIYLDHPVPVLSEWPPADGSVAAVVMLKKDGDPVPNFPGWTIWCDLISRKHHWYMLTPRPYQKDYPRIGTN
jgi:4-amino-4-deoxy-L-arabinose transferase-like glycosyltransferase